MVDKIKIALSLLLVAAGVVGFYLLADQATVLRVLAVAAGVIAGGVLFCVATEPGSRFVLLWREALVELKKVVWPTRKEALQMTGMVFAFVVVMAIFLFLTDKTLEWVMYDLVLGWKS
ncbi:protein translocase subunit SecE [Betaproteobacteria bacterium]|nr:protein translocase subunit SecE [Betaproteobacteria bacterium]GHU14615.1 protein translocase subunit SecE [Betaproteobacteria bacterium]GHU48077.1 protein translocase subunit SecE [Betaproteobacteria bacterium]